MASKQKEFSSLLELMKAIPDEQAAIDHFTAIRWKDGAYCPYCGSVKVYHFSDRRTHKCGDKDCRQRFSIKVGTVFEDSKLPLRTWMLAVWFITSHKKGISSVQLAKDLDVTQQTAWFMMHRLRHAARTRSFNRPLGGQVEVDETFIGGKAKNRHKDKRGNSGVTGGAGKAIVAGAIQRKGRVVAPDKLSKRLGPHILDYAGRLSHQAWNWFPPTSGVGYKHLGKEYPHIAVDHADGEYVRGEAHTNTIEGYWSQLKRQIYGIHHWVSGKHLARYVDESSWRYNHRDSEEAPRFNKLLAETDGRLRYAELIA